MARYTVERATVNSSASSRGGVATGLPQRHEQGFLLATELGLLAAEPSFGFGDGHPFTGTGPGEVGLELGDHGQDGEQQPADGVGGVVDRAAEVELDAAGGELVDDVAGVGY